MTYLIKLSIDMGNAFPPIGDMLKRVNDEIASLGYREKLSVRSKYINATLTSGRELTAKEKQLVIKTMVEQFNASQPAWKVKVESFRRKSGNVQQSAA